MSSSAESPAQWTVVPMEVACRVWQRVHIDFAEKDGNYFLGLIDSHSKWIEVAHTRSTTAQSTIDQMRLVWFAAYSFYVQKVLLMPPAVLNKTPCGSDFPAHKRKVI